MSGIVELLGLRRLGFPARGEVCSQSEFSRALSRMHPVSIRHLETQARARGVTVPAIATRGKRALVLRVAALACHCRLTPFGSDARKLIRMSEGVLCAGCFEREVSALAEDKWALKKNSPRSPNNVSHDSVLIERIKVDRPFRRDALCSARETRKHLRGANGLSDHLAAPLVMNIITCMGHYVVMPPKSQRACLRPRHRLLFAAGTAVAVGATGTVQAVVDMESFRQRFMACTTSISVESGNS